jgi:hypothetical protein
VTNERHVDQHAIYTVARALGYEHKKTAPPSPELLASIHEHFCLGHSIEKVAEMHAHLPRPALLSD